MSLPKCTVVVTGTQIEDRAYLVTSDTDECTLIHITLEESLWGIPQGQVMSWVHSTWDGA